MFKGHPKGLFIAFFANMGVRGAQVPGRRDHAPADAGTAGRPRACLFRLITTYFLLTIAELFLSPIGISFVSRVAPPQYKGLMQGGWFAATGIGILLVGLMGGLWMALPLWMLWLILVAACLLSAAFMIAIMKKLERAAAS